MSQKETYITLMERAESAAMYHVEINGATCFTDPAGLAFMSYCNDLLPAFKQTSTCFDLYSAFCGMVNDAVLELTQSNMEDLE